MNHVYYKKKIVNSMKKNVRIALGGLNSEWSVNVPTFILSYVCTWKRFTKVIFMRFEDIQSLSFKF